jgi:kinesin family protein 4/21/27
MNFLYNSESYSQIILGEEKQRNSKVRRRTTQPQELLYGVHANPENTKDDQNQNHNHPLTRVPSAPGSLK